MRIEHLDIYLSSLLSKKQDKVKTITLLLILSVSISAQTGWDIAFNKADSVFETKLKVGTSYLVLKSDSFEVYSYSMRSQVDTSSYCKGFKKGYAEGFCYKIVGCVDPVPPVCPIPDVGFEEYKDGYNDGFALGRKHRKKKQ